MLSKKQSFIKGAIIISLGGFISKVLGAVYRIPLTNILGGEGMGIYQMVYPLYCILLTVSASGIPTGIARLISSGKGYGAEKQAFRLYGAVGIIGTMLMFMLSGPLADIQGEPSIALCCKLLSPSVFFCVRIVGRQGIFPGQRQYVSHCADRNSGTAYKGCGGCCSFLYVPRQPCSGCRVHAACRDYQRSDFHCRRGNLVFKAPL